MIDRFAVDRRRAPVDGRLPLGLWSASLIEIMKNNNEIALRQSRCCIEWYRELLFFKLNDITTGNSAFLGVYHPLLNGSSSGDVDNLLCTS